MKKYIVFIPAFLFVFIVNHAQIDRTKPPKPGPAPEIKIGTYETFTLDNGLNVFVVEDHKLPRVSFSLRFDYDPVLEREYAGYVGIAGQLIGTATENRSKDQLNEEIDFIGATLNTGASSVFGSSLKKHTNTLLDLMSDVILHSKLTQEELEKIKTRTLSSLKASLKDPDNLSSRLSRVIFYGGDHPYGEITTEESLERINLEMCQEFYDKYYNPSQAYMAIVGDITLAEAKPLIEQYFGKWKPKPVVEKTYETPQSPTERKVIIHDRPESVQSVIKVGYPVELVTGSQEVIPTYVMNTILGGGTYRLFENLRETHGWTYGAYSRISSDRLVGNFQAFTSVRNEVTDSAIVEILYEMERLKNDPVPEEELTRVKNYRSGNFALALEKPETVASFALNTAMYNLPNDYYKNYLKRVSDVSQKDVRKAAKEYLKPDRSYIFVVGNAADIVGSLTKLSGNNQVLYIDENGNYYEPTEKTSELPEDLTANDVIDRYIEAQGGRQKLMDVETMRMEMSMSMQGMPVKITRIHKAPDKFIMMVSMQGNVVQKSAYDGENGIITGVQGTQEITEKELEKLKLEASINPELKYNELGYGLELVSVEQVKGNPAYKILMTSPVGDKITDYYDTQSGLKVKSEQTLESQMGMVEQITYFEDYKEVEGYLVPHKLEQEINGQAMDITIEKVEINIPVEDEIFEVEK